MGFGLWLVAMLPLWDAHPPRRTPVITGALIAVNAVVFFHEAQLAMDGRVRPFLMNHALVPSRFLAETDAAAQWLTLLTHMFLHGGMVHLLGNCWFLWVFGRNVEDRLGPLRFLTLYLLAGVAAAALQLAVTPDSGAPMLGASGAISGVLGAYLLLFPTAWIYTLVPWIVPIIPVPAFVFLVLWFVIQAFNGLGSMLAGGGGGGGVAWWAHAGGFVAGMGLLLLGPRRAGRR